MTIEWPKPDQSPIFESAPPRPTFLVDVSDTGDSRVVRVTGELDLATRNRLVSLSTAGHHPAIVIDLGGVTFMDCSGYSALVASRVVIERDGRSARVNGLTGQPARLVDLIAELESVHTSSRTIASESSAVEIRI